MKKRQAGSAKSLVLAATLIFVASGVAFASAPAVTNRPTLANLESLIANSATKNKAPAPSTDVPPLTNLAGNWWTSINPHPVSTNKGNKCTSDPGFQAFVPSNAASLCTFGDGTATRTIFEFGDSNSIMWLPALDSLGYDLNWRVVSISQAGCTPWKTPWSPSNTRLWGNMTSGLCNSWRKGIMAVIHSLKPAIVIPVGVEPFATNIPVPTPAALTASIEAMIKAIQGDGSKVIFLQPAPRYPASNDQGPVNCLGVYPNNVLSCTLSLKGGTDYLLPRTIASVSKLMKIVEVPTQNLFCT